MQATYRGSAEERADLLRRYTKCGGDMRLVFSYVMLSREGVDDRRFMAALDDAIEQGAAARAAGSVRCAPFARALARRGRRHRQGG